jgi:hypothetical protein
VLRLWDGLSAFQTEAQARQKGRELPRLGRFIVRLELPDSTAIRAERTLDGEGHYTLWGEPSDFLRCVVSTVLVE